MSLIQDRVFQRKPTSLVFSYGTLKDKFIHNIVGEATLKGNYTLDDEGMFPELRRGNSYRVIYGYLLELDEEELKEADDYESDLYKREILPISKDGEIIHAWVYLFNQ